MHKYGRDFGDGLLPDVSKPSQLQRSERPGDRITIEEMRLDLCSRVGPYRIVAGKSTIFTLPFAVPIQIAVGRGINKVPTFVRVEPVGYAIDGTAYAPFHLSLSTMSINPMNRLISTVVGSVDLILLAGEVLWATQNDSLMTVSPEIKVTEIVV